MANFQNNRFTETQSFAGWGYAILGVTTIASVGSVAAASRGSNWLWLTPALSLSLAFNLLCLRTTVTETELSVSFGALFPLYRRRFALADIQAVQAVTYAPLAEYGGWGIRGWGRSVAMNARGDRGVRLTLRDGRRILVGSQHPDALAEALTGPR